MQLHLCTLSGRWFETGLGFRICYYCIARNFWGVQFSRFSRISVYQRILDPRNKHDCTVCNGHDRARPQKLPPPPPKTLAMHKNWHISIWSRASAKNTPRKLWRQAMRENWHESTMSCIHIRVWTHTLCQHTLCSALPYSGKFSRGSIFVVGDLYH
jgi:hypothetical protein